MKTLVYTSVVRPLKRLLRIHDLPRVDGVASADWYDAVYRNSDGYSAPYWDSHYYFIWTVLADRIRQSGAKSILDIGCGPGQFAACLFDMAGIDTYTGLDFSAEAIRMAQRSCPRGTFLVGDALTTSLHGESGHDVTVCTEVLEHVPDDHGVLQHFRGRCLCTVPNFPYDSHVRHFRDAEEVAERYGQHFTTFDVWPLRGHHSRDQVYFLIDGVA